MKLYHWKLDCKGKPYDYLVMAKSLEAARTALIANIQTPGGVQAQACGHDRMIAEQEPTFVAGENYPIVIW
jgi:hypothetical protein